MPHTNTEPSVSVDPATITFNQATELLVADPLYDIAKAFYEGDHWQNGDAWVGPTIEEDADDGAIVMKEIEAELVSHPAIEEIVERHMNATVGGEPTAGLVPKRVIPAGEEPTPEEQGVMDRARAAIRAWWDEKEVLDKFQRAVIDLQLGGRGLLRLFVPEGELVADGEDSSQARVPSGDFEEQLERIWVTYVEAEQGVVIRDPITMRQLGVYVYEVLDVLTGKPTQIAELTYLDDQGKTVIRTVRLERGAAGSKEGQSSSSDAMDLNRRLTLYQMKSKRIVTKPVLDNQKLLNMALTMMGRNVVLGGFLERVILNGQMPGEFKEIEGKKTWVPDPYKTSIATTQWIGGVQIGKNPETGDPVIATPDIKWREPVSVDTFVDTAEAAYRNILHGARQLHVIISGDAIASGESRKQARDDYEKSLKRTKSKVDAAGTWLVDAALSMAATFAGQPDMFKDFRVVFDAKIDAGPLSAEDRQAMQTEVTNNVRSRKSYMIEARITDDPTAEKQEILKEQSELPGVQREMPGLSDRRNVNDNPPMNNPPEPDNNLPAN